MKTFALAAVLLLTVATARAQAPATAARASGPDDTLRVEVGSPAVNARVYAPHAARVRVWVGDGQGRLVNEWTNELTLGDSAGRPVMRWVTIGTQPLPGGDTAHWELRQTYDGITMAPLGYWRTGSNGAAASLRIDGRRVTGWRRAPGDTATIAVDQDLDRPGYFSGASDLVPLAVGLREGLIVSAPMWAPNMTRAEQRVFTVRGRRTVDVEGTPVTAWQVDEHRLPDRTLLATWYLTEGSPYMVYGEVPMPNGQVRRMTEVAIPR